MLIKTDLNTIINTRHVTYIEGWLEYLRAYQTEHGVAEAQQLKRVHDTYERQHQKKIDYLCHLTTGEALWMTNQTFKNLQNSIRS